MDKQFSTVGWAKGSNIYEVNIRQYTREGTFAAFSEHLPRLKDMGVEILWLMPITPVSEKIRQGTLGSYYACSSYTDVNPEFGTLADFKELVQTAHSLGFKLIIDWVANHTGWDHHWSTTHPDWYLHDAAGNFTEKNGWHDVIDLNFEMPAMRTALIDAMRFWVNEYHIDGFRCDMAHLVPLDFWQEARIKCEVDRPLYWLAECETVEYHNVFDTSYAWWWMHVSEDHAKGINTLDAVRNVLHAYSQYPEGATKLFFTANHDENSWNGTEFEKYDGAAKAWAVFTCTWQRGIPMIYSGQESPNTKRLKFFDKDVIDWNDPLKLNGFYKTLLALRKRNKAVSEGETFILPSHAGNQLMTFIRRQGDDCVLVLLNLSNDNRINVGITHDWLQGKFVNIFSGISFFFNKTETFELQAGEYIVYEKTAL